LTGSCAGDSGGGPAMVFLLYQFTWCWIYLVDLEFVCIFVISRQF
jgi:hypothetical protein